MRVQQLIRQKYDPRRWAKIPAWARLDPDKKETAFKDSILELDNLLLTATNQEKQIIENHRTLLLREMRRCITRKFVK